VADTYDQGRSSQVGAATTRELKSDVQEVKDTAVRQGEAKAEQMKEGVGRTATSAASAIDKAAAELRDDKDAPDWLASGFSSVAKQIEDLAGRLQNKSPRELAGETRRFARNNPTSFLAASAAAGFLAARFLRAGAEYDDDYDVGTSGSSDRSSSGSYSDAGTAQAQTSYPASTASTGAMRQDETVAQRNLRTATTTGESG
jgi:hypothetical protein